MDRYIFDLDYVDAVEMIWWGPWIVDAGGV